MATDAMLETKQLKICKTIIEVGGFTRAGARPNLSRPAIGQRLRALERRHASVPDDVPERPEGHAGATGSGPPRDARERDTAGGVDGARPPALLPGRLAQLQPPPLTPTSVYHPVSSQQKKNGERRRKSGAAL